MRRILALTMGALATLLVASAAAAPAPLKLKPVSGTFKAPDYTQQTGNSTNAQAQWTNKAALDGKFSVLLEKTVATADYAYAAAIVEGVEGMTVGDLGTIGFSTKGTYCGGGSPRFNLYYDNNGDGAADGVGFYGCGNHVSGTPAPGWTSMTVTNPAIDDNGTVVGASSTVVQLSVLVDETGSWYVDRVIAGGNTTGEPNGS